MTKVTKAQAKAAECIAAKLEKVALLIKDAADEMSELSNHDGINGCKCRKNHSRRANNMVLDAQIKLQRIRELKMWE